MTVTTYRTSFVLTKTVLRVKWHKECCGSNIWGVKNTGKAVALQHFAPGRTSSEKGFITLYRSLFYVTTVGCHSCLCSTARVGRRLVECAV